MPGAGPAGEKWQAAHEPRPALASASSPLLFDIAIKLIKRVTRFFSPPSCDVTSRYLSDAFQLSVLLYPSVSHYLHGSHSSGYGLFLGKLRPREVRRTAEAVREAGEPGRSPGWLLSAHLLPGVALLCTATSHRASRSRGQRSARRPGLAQGALCLPRACAADPGVRTLPPRIRFPPGGCCPPWCSDTWRRGETGTFAGVREPIQKFHRPRQPGGERSVPISLKTHTGMVIRGSSGFQKNHTVLLVILPRVLFLLLAESTRGRIVLLGLSSSFSPLPSFPRGSFLSVPLTYLPPLGKQFKGLLPGRLKWR